MARARVMSPMRLSSACHVLICLFALGWGTNAHAEIVTRAMGHARYAVRVVGQGRPTVVLEAGSGEDHRTWDQIIPRLEKCTKVVAYDRLGIGRSGPLASAGPVLASDVADRLANLLQALDAKPPYLLVGHSIGGLYVQSFARRFPDRVAAVVLVDSASPFEPPGMFVPTKPPEPGSTVAAEDAGFLPSVKAMLAGPAFPSVPLVVLAATKHGVSEKAEAIWQDVQARTAKLSAKGHLDVIHDTDHFIQNERPDRVVAAILRAASQAGFDLSACKGAR